MFTRLKSWISLIIGSFVSLVTTSILNIWILLIAFRLVIKSFVNLIRGRFILYWSLKSLLRTKFILTRIEVTFSLKIENASLVSSPFKKCICSHSESSCPLFRWRLNISLYILPFSNFKSGDSSLKQMDAFPLPEMMVPCVWISY